MNEQPCARQVTLSGRSRTIGKTTTQQKPMIRIVHLVPPEIIKTDADNFRELVQRLTGKQQPRSNCAHAAKARISKLCRRNKITAAATSSSERTTTSMPDVFGHDDRRSLPPTTTRTKGGDIAHGKLTMGHDEGEENGKMHESDIWMQGDDELVAATATSGGLGDVEGLFFNVSPLMLNPVMRSSSLMDDVHAAAAWRIEEGGDR